MGGLVGGVNEPMFESSNCRRVGTIPDIVDVGDRFCMQGQEEGVGQLL